MKILVTGATGAIGSALTAQLASLGHTLLISARDHVKLEALGTRIPGRDDPVGTEHVNSVVADGRNQDVHLRDGGGGELMRHSAWQHSSDLYTDIIHCMAN